jgi:hypothetical protein
MKKAFYVLTTVTILTSCGNRAGNQRTVETHGRPDRIEILYFRSPQRCVICNNIETRTRELLDSLYPDETANGEIVYRMIELSGKENKPIADKYEAAWTSLFINRWKDGQETVNNMTEYAISHSMHPSRKFKEGLENKIEELRKQ